MDEGNWYLAESEIDGLIAFVRFRDNVESLILSRKYSRYLRVVWEFAADEYGLPNDEDTQRLEDFENNLCEALEADDHAVLTFAMTNDGLRQWVFYTQDVQESGRRINKMPQEKERYPIELTTEEDPNWEEYKKVAANYDDEETEIIDNEEA